MSNPMERKEQQVRKCTNLAEKIFTKMSAHDKRVFVRGLADALALKMSPAARDEWIERMQNKIAAPSDDTPHAA